MTSPEDDAEDAAEEALLDYLEELADRPDVPTEHVVPEVLDDRPAVRLPEPSPDRIGRPPSEQWWTINGQAIMDALQRAHEGAEPWLVYLEMIADSDSEDYGRPPLDP